MIKSQLLALHSLFNPGGPGSVLGCNYLPSWDSFSSYLGVPNLLIFFMWGAGSSLEHAVKGLKSIPNENNTSPSLKQKVWKGDENLNNKKINVSIKFKWSPNWLC